MKKIKFIPNGNPIMFPDDISLFTDIGAVSIGGASYVTAIYIGTLPLDEYIEESRAEKLQALNQWHDSKTTEMKAKYSQSEVDSFLDKRNEAMAWRVDNTVATPYVTAMSGGNEVVRVALLNSILSKVDATAQLEAYVLMKRDEIEACATQAELEAVTW